MERIFTQDNTEWVTDEHGVKHLEYTGDIDELSEKTGRTEEDLLDLLLRYEEESKDAIETQREIDEARKGEY